MSSAKGETWHLRNPPSVHFLSYPSERSLVASLYHFKMSKKTAWWFQHVLYILHYTSLYNLYNHFHQTVMMKQIQDLAYGDQMGTFDSIYIE